MEREHSVEQPVYYPRNRWRVRPAPDHDPPSFTALPRLVLNRGMNYGWGPTTQIHFAIEPGEEPVLVLVDVGPDDVYYRDRRHLLVWPHKGQVSLYSGPCGSNFRPKAGKVYNASFRLMDAAGNLGGGGPAFRVWFVAPDAEHNER